ARRDHGRRLPRPDRREPQVRDRLPRLVRPDRRDPARRRRPQAPPLTVRACGGGGHRSAPASSSTRAPLAVTSPRQAAGARGTAEVADRYPPPSHAGLRSAWTRSGAPASVPLMAEGESGARTRPELFRLTTRARAAG